MKTKFKLFTLMLMITILSAGKTVLAEEKTKEFHESWAASSVESLEIINKFGEIKVQNNGGSEITIDVVVTVEAANENKVNDLLNKIDVSIRKSGNTVKAETTIENNFNSQRKFSIDYVINVPSDKNLKISNKYGNTIVNKLTANGDFEIKYGNLSANSLEAPASGSMKIELAYGNATIGTANDLTASVAYSPISIDVVKNLKIESKYSQINVEKASVVNSESKYDKLQFGELKSLTASTKYSHIKVDELAISLKIEAGYGSVKVGQVSKDFESISITNSYGQISLGLDNASYSVDANCDYCGISYPEENFKGNRMKESHTQTINGKVGIGGGTIMIRSRYGDIKLND
jgi:hypothetical protein